MTGLVVYESMRTAIAQAHQLDEVAAIASKAEALRHYARQTRQTLEDVNRLMEIKLRAQRRGGELMQDMERAQGKRTDLVTSVQREPKLGSAPLKDQVVSAGLSLTEAKRWQLLAELPAQVFDAHITTTIGEGGELSTALLLRRAQENRRDQLRKAMAEPGAFPAGLFRVLYADPPWQYGNNGVKTPDDNYGVVERHYPTMPTVEICALQRDGRRVRDLALPDAVLFCWATTAMLPDALEVIDAWGFTYKTNFVWDKQRHNFGHYSSVQHELLLLATRGSCLPDINEKMRSVIQAPMGVHSAKPEKFRELIDTLYPYGPRLELFRRGEAPGGWHVWGNQADRGTEP